MGRPSLADVRTAEILDAFERCVARFGLEGSSLEKVADEAGMKRSILRHYVGNRDDLVHALAERVLGKYREQFGPLPVELAADERIDRVLDRLFPDQPVESTESVLVIEALIGSAAQYPDVGRLVFDYVEHLVGTTATELGQARPNASADDCWAVAYGIVSLWFNQESLAPLDLPPRYLAAAHANARRLIDDLTDGRVG